MERDPSDLSEHAEAHGGNSAHGGGVEQQQHYARPHGGGAAGAAPPVVPPEASRSRVTVSCLALKPEGRPTPQQLLSTPLMLVEAAAVKEEHRQAESSATPTKLCVICCVAPVDGSLVCESCRAPTPAVSSHINLIPQTHDPSKRPKAAELVERDAIASGGVMCDICWGTFSDLVALPCHPTHAFCSTCVSEISTCPKCMVPVKKTAAANDGCSGAAPPPNTSGCSRITSTALDLRNAFPRPSAPTTSYALEGAAFTEGRASKIFRARGPSGSLVAVKVFELPSHEPRALRDAVEAINGEFIVRSVGEHPYLLASIALEWPTPSRAHIVMGYAGGGSAQQRLSAAWAASHGEGGSSAGGSAAALASASLFAPAEVVSVGHNLLSALSRLHACSTLHLDVKPANTLFLDSTSTPPRARSAVLSTFGTTRVVRLLSKSIRAAWGGVGTEHFMAPEVLFRLSKGTDKADVWSLGATLLALLSGFEIGDEDGGCREQWIIARDRQLEDWDKEAFFAPGAETLPLSARGPWAAAPEALRALIVSCLALKPEGRPTPQQLLSTPLMLVEAAAVKEEHRQAESSATPTKLCVICCVAPVDGSLVCESCRAPTPAVSSHINLIPEGELVFTSDSVNVSTGGLGVVRRAMWCGAPVAVKSLRRALGDAGENAAHDFLREVAALTHLRHPNIVRVLGVCDHVDGRLSLVQELAEGGESLYARLHGAGAGTLTATEVARVGRDVARGLAYGHAQGATHNDLRSINIVLDSGGRAIIIDFGLVRRVRTALPNTMRAILSSAAGVGSAQGASAWTAPENFDEGSAGNGQPPADIYSFGCVLFEIATGRVPWEGKSIDHITRAVNDRHRPDVPAHVDARFAALIARCWAHDPNERPKAAELVVELDAIASSGVECEICLRTFSDLVALPCHPTHAFCSTCLSNISQCPKCMRSCAVCAKPSTLFCGQCHTRWYCSPRHQRSDWRDGHKDACKTIKDETDERIAVSIARVRTGEVGLECSKEMLETRLAALRKTKGDDDAETLRAICDLAQVWRQYDKHSEAEALFRELVERCERVHGEEHPQTFAALGSLASVLSAQRKFLEAVRLSRRALDGTIRLVGEEHEESIIVAVSHAALLRDMDQHPEAEALYRTTLAISRRVLGDEHRTTLISLSGLTLSLAALGRVNESEPILRECLETRRRVLGNKHPDTLASIRDVARLLDHTGRLDEAEPLYVEVLKGYRASMGEGHADTKRTAAYLDELRQQRARASEAVEGETDERVAVSIARAEAGEGILGGLEEHLAARLASLRQVRGDDHVITLVAMGNLAEKLLQQGKLRESEALYREALERYQRVCGAEHPATLTALGCLAGLYLRQRRYGEALPLSLRVFEGMRSVHGAEHEKSVISAHNHSALLRGMGKHRDAEALSRNTLAIARRVLGNEHGTTLAVLSGLAFSLYSQGRFNECEPLMREDLDTARRVLGNDHPRTLAAINNFARLFHERRQYGAAERLYREALATSRRVLSPTHPDLLTAAYNLGALLSSLRQWGEAETLLAEALAGRTSTLGADNVDTHAAAATLEALRRARGGGVGGRGR